MESSCFYEMNLLDNRKDIVLTDDDVFLAVHFDFGAAVFREYNAVARLDRHNDFLAVNDAAGADSYNFRYLGLFFC